MGQEYGLKERGPSPSENSDERLAIGESSIKWEEDVAVSVEEKKEREGEGED